MIVIGLTGSISGVLELLSASTSPGPSYTSPEVPASPPAVPDHQQGVCARAMEAF